MTKPDTALGDLSYLSDCIEPGDWNANPSILQVLDLHALRLIIASGDLDSALEALADISKDPADSIISRHSRRLSDSLGAWKEAHRPVSLEEARKIGLLPSKPFYPPLDSPTVFWRDSVLCVVQKESGASPGMRTWNPHSGAWSKVEKIRYPETGIAGLYVLGCDNLKYLHYPYRNCWSRKMKRPSDLTCPLLECAPLLILDDSIPGSVEKADDLARAGGSSAAGWGRYKFAEDGFLYRMQDRKVGWRVLPGSAPPVFGTKEYGLNEKHNYPVVVSPNQEWVAFALRSKDGVSIELWMGRLRYNK